LALKQRDYAKLSVLLLESSGPMRSAIFYMLRDLGVEQLSVATLSAQVLDLFDEHAFDIVLLGHNGRDSTTGIQLLEEARYRGYIRATTGWILMTSDSSQETILHALDSRPDDLLTKPFSQEELHQRISSIVAQKRALKPVSLALEQGDPKAVIQACKRIPRLSTAYHDASLIRARALIDLGEAPDAVQLLERYYWEEPEKELGVTLAYAYLSVRRLDDAQALLSNIVDHYPLFLQAYDLLARVLEYQGELDEAREILQAATAKSPLGIPRQLELGRVATQSNAYDVARLAYKKSINLGRKSCYRSSEPHLKLANITRLQINSSPDRAHAGLIAEIRETLAKAQQEFPKDDELRVRAELVLNETYLAVGDIESASRALSRADMLNSSLRKPLNLTRERDALNNDPVPVLEPLKVPDSVAAVEADEAPKRDPQMSAKVNRIGIKHYLAGKRAQAIRYFGMATEYDPTNALAYLNLAQLFLESARDDTNRRDERLRMVDRYLRLTQRMQLADELMERQNTLVHLRETPAEKLPKGSLGMLLQ